MPAVGDFPGEERGLEVRVIGECGGRSVKAEQERSFFHADLPLIPA